MSSELISILEGLAHDRGVDKEVLIALVEESVATALRRVENKELVHVQINRKNGNIEAWLIRKVVEAVHDPVNEISLAEAQLTQPQLQLGEEYRDAIPKDKLSRIAAQATGQIIRQKLRMAEKLRICEEFEDKVGQIISGSVRRVEQGAVYIDFGRAEGCMEHKDRIPGEEYRIGDHLTVLLTQINPDKPGPSLFVSRSNPDFIRKLFEREVSEISTGIVEIKAIAREPGSRTKIAVAALPDHPKVDPVGACVGVRGNRVKVILQELNGEKVDIVAWDATIQKFVANALMPAKLVSVKIDEANHQIQVTAAEDQLSLAIGKKGQNARLASRLTGWGINIAKAEETPVPAPGETMMNEWIAAMAAVPGIEPAEAKILVEGGFNSVAGIVDASTADLAALEGITPERAETIMEAAKKYAAR